MTFFLQELTSSCVTKFHEKCSSRDRIGSKGFFPAAHPVGPQTCQRGMPCHCPPPITHAWERYRGGSRTGGGGAQAAILPPAPTPDTQSPGQRCPGSSEPRLPVGRGSTGPEGPAGLGCSPTQSSVAQGGSLGPCPGMGSLHSPQLRTPAPEGRWGACAWCLPRAVSGYLYFSRTHFRWCCCLVPTPPDLRPSWREGDINHTG